MNTIFRNFKQRANFLFPQKGQFAEDELQLEWVFYPLIVSNFWEVPLALDTAGIDISWLVHVENIAKLIKINSKNFQQF